MIDDAVLPREKALAKLAVEMPGVLIPYHGRGQRLVGIIVVFDDQGPSIAAYPSADAKDIADVLKMVAREIVAGDVEQADYTIAGDRVGERKAANEDADGDAAPE